ncbi:hypothetical protein LF63_0103325 [Oleiagrimonas soli]|uniref:Uncharacterized protein n=1 Tax=Oleiagrimonas soli TaxID=1543381 RepID=A0A099CY16_9GAMM|nr:hypothetical protein LF63_0103325 [Oleiagrimonas soli]
MARHGQIKHARGFQNGFEASKELTVFSDVLDDIEKADSAETGWRESALLECGAKYVIHSAFCTCVERTFVAGFEQHDFIPACLQHGGYEAISSADVEQCPFEGVVLDYMLDASVAVVEPERIVFDLETRSVTVFGIRDILFMLCHENAVPITLQV